MTEPIDTAALRRLLARRDAAIEAIDAGRAPDVTYYADLHDLVSFGLLALPALLDAADERDRLRSENAVLRGELDGFLPAMDGGPAASAEALGTNAALRAEVARLRDALATLEVCVEQARVMVATRHEEAGEMSLHREAMERIYREGFADITNALKALTTPTIIANESGIGSNRCTSLITDRSTAERCTRHEGHTGNHIGNTGKEWT